MTSAVWWDKTWNPIVGCDRVSEGCRNCWAILQAHVHYRKEFTVRREDGRIDWTTRKAFPDRLEQPFHWKKPSRIAVGLMGDLYHEDFSSDFRRRIYDVVERCPQHTFIIVTKRPRRMHAEIMYSMIFERMRREGPLPNLWVLTSIEDQKTADERIPWILRIPAAIRGVSVEPMLGEVNLTHLPNPGFGEWQRYYDALKGEAWCVNQYGDIDRSPCEPKIHWVICGGESGSGARPVFPYWIRSIRDQCRMAGTAFFFKQWGEWSHNRGTKNPRRAVFVGSNGMIEDGSIGIEDDLVLVHRVGKRAAGRVLDGREWLEFPEVRS